MVLPTSGPLGIGDMAAEFLGTPPEGMGEYYAGGALVPAGTTGTSGAVPSSGALGMGNFYGTARTVYPSATGGAVTTIGDFRYHTYTASGTFQVTDAGSPAATFDILVVGGGGGSGSNGFAGGLGGGGAGDMVEQSMALAVGSYAITVGAGGAARANGGNSQFGALSPALGGGYGGDTINSTYADRSRDGNGGNGGSGGGAGGNPHNDAARPAPFPGGRAPGVVGFGNGGGGTWGWSSAGGGGGAGAAGSGTNGTGGAGRAWLNGTFYAGGGGGGQNDQQGSCSQSAGGVGGGGASGSGCGSTGNPGTAGLGGGGGGGARRNGGGSSGGSGVVIIRYRYR